MSSWVRYSVAVYLGLLISGALAHPPRYKPSDEPVVAPSVHYEAPPSRCLPVPEPTQPTKADVSV